MRCRILILCAILLWVISDGLYALPLYDYGLHFRSHAVTGGDRTSLYLDDNVPFSVKRDFSVSFQMYTRDNEPDYGSILHLKTNTGQVIHLSFVATEENHQPALVLNEGVVNIDTPIRYEQWIDVTVRLRLKDNVVEVVYDGKHASAMVPLQGTSDVAVLFGLMKEYLSDVAPVNIRDISVVQDGTQTCRWKLWKHNDTLCYDELQGAVARAENPFWLIDKHIEWQTVYHQHLPHQVFVACNARDANFYLVDDQEVSVLDENGIVRQVIPVRKGGPTIKYSNHILYDTLSNSLVSYSLRLGTVSVFSFDTGMWSDWETLDSEPRYYNHARAFNPADSSFYFFGGYGFYRYRNDLFRMKSGSGHVEQIEYKSPLYPRFSAAMAVVGDELYIFGGRGNKYGKQELTSEYFYGLCALNLKTRQSRLIWKRQGTTENTVMASSMYFEPSDSSFYAVSMSEGGTLWKIAIRDSVCMEVSKPINNRAPYQDLDINLYVSATHGKLFLVMDKILSDRSHDLAIYSINMPLVDEADILQNIPNQKSWNKMLLWIGIVALLAIPAILFRRRHRKNHADAVSEPIVEPEECHGETTAVEAVTEPLPPLQPALPEKPQYYNRSRSAISLLGCFNVRDKQGNDITASFTPRLKHLLLLLVLYTEKQPQGLLTSKTVEILWPDKEETAARNNRNVTLRKLRVLLESIGDVEIVTESNFLRIRLGDDVFCDFHAVSECIRLYQEQANDELLNRILELLLYGPLLPNTFQNWLDDFKEAYSSKAIDLLRGLLELELQRNHQEMVIRLADIMFLHDPLNEEALTAKCSVLCAQGKRGIARNVYERFCKIYLESMGEPYRVSFADL